MCSRAAIAFLTAFACASCDSVSPQGGVAIAWRVELGRDGGGWQGLPARTPGAWVGLVNGQAWAFAANSGSRLWEAPLTSRTVGVARNVWVEDGLAVVADADTVFALSDADGAVVWRFPAPGGADRCEIAISGGTVFFGTREHRVYAVGLTTGVERWSVDLGPGWTFRGIVTGTTASGDTLYVAVEQWLDANGASRRGHIVALDVATGAERWRFVGTGHNTVSSAPRVADRLLLGADLFNGFFAVDRFTTEEVWRVGTAEAAFGALHAPVTRDGTVFAGTQGGVYAVDRADGTVRWKREDLVGATDVALCGDVLLVQNQTIQVLDPRSGSSLGSLLVDPVDFPTSDIAVGGAQAFVIGNVAAYGLTCG